MKEYVFKPTRIINGKRVKSDYWYGRFTLPPDPKVHQIPLQTPDKEVARKRLREKVLEAQREQEGIIAPKGIRESAHAPLPGLIAEYKQDLTTLGNASGHIRDTTRRLERMVREARWKTLSDIQPASFVKWRSTLAGSAKTVKEYQVSLNAFLNWLVSMVRLEANPLAKVAHVETRGKQVRESRAFTEDELRRLFAVAGRRLPAYLMLLYTGMRRDEARGLVWGDVQLRTPQPYVLIRDTATKDKDKRAIPLHSKLATILREMRPASASDTDSIFHGRFPTRDSLLRDLTKAGIEQKDALGRVVHFHAFRKTWQTMGVRYGINQRAAQEVLGHSDPALTAKVYTDVAALSLHSEIAKLPWITSSPHDAPAPVDSRPPMSLQSSGMGDSPHTQNVESKTVSPSMSLYDMLRQAIKMVVGSGFEPSINEEVSDSSAGSSDLAGASASPYDAPETGPLAELLRDWDALSWGDKSAALALLDKGVAA